MLPTVPLFGFSVQSMWLMCLAGAGVCCAFCAAPQQAYGSARRGYHQCGRHGAYRHSGRRKALYLLTIAPLLVQNWRRLVQAPALLAEITLTSGTVYYGGLLGFIASVHWYLHGIT